jgi:hypothetical protein
MDEEHRLRILEKEIKDMKKYLWKDILDLEVALIKQKTA